MILPPLLGNFKQSGFFIYAVADSRYFDLYGRGLVNSVLTNTNYGVHLHLYDPDPEQIAFCNQSRVSVTWEYLNPNQFDSALTFWSQRDLEEPWASRKLKMLGMKQFVDDHDLLLWIRKTYFACMRFVRLSEFLPGPCRFLEIDIDGVVRSDFPVRFDDDDSIDLYLYEKIKIHPVTKELQRKGHLAGSILFTPKDSALRFIHDLGSEIKKEILSDHLYWFLDQNVLDRVIVDYRKGDLSLDYVDWHMNPHSAIWTAKGKRKELEIFQQELSKYR